MKLLFKDRSANSSAARAPWDARGALGIKRNSNFKCVRPKGGVKERSGKAEKMGRVRKATRPTALLRWLII